MKPNTLKILILLLILIAIPFITTEKTSVVLPGIIEPEFKVDKNWEYVKDRLFTEGDVYVKRFRDSIYLDLKNAREQDIQTVEKTIAELQILMPQNSIRILSDTEYDKQIRMIRGRFRPVINLNFYEKSDEKVLMELTDNKTILSDGNIISRNVRRIDRMWIFSYSNINFILKHDHDLEERKKWVRYEILRSLVYLNKEGYQTNQNTNSVYNSYVFHPENYDFTEKDKFLLQKLYAPNFLSQFKDYMYSHYPWRYAGNFINKSLMKIYAITIVVVLGVLLFVLLFSLLHNKSLKYNFLKYLITVYSILIALFSLYSIFSFMTYLNGVRDGRVYFTSIVMLIFYAVSISFTIWGLEKVFIKKDRTIYLDLVFKVSFTFIAFISPFGLIFIFNDGLQSDLESFIPVLILSLSIGFLRGVFIYLNHFSDSLIKEKDVELSRLKELNAQNELKSLHAHINPHFLYNALNSIASLVYESPKKTEEMTISLSDLFKYSINRKGEKMSTIANEVEMVENYLKIEKIRFEERLNFNINVEEGLLDKEIPMYVLQPLIENAIKHGISKIEEDGKIELVLKMEEEKLLITVSDNGPDFPDGLLCGHGLQSVYDLLRLSYGELASMNWENTPEKRIVISITSKL